jgi:vesicle-associated membrane protein 7
MIIYSFITKAGSQQVLCEWAGTNISGNFKQITTTVLSGIKSGVAKEDGKRVIMKYDDNSSFLILWGKSICCYAMVNENKPGNSIVFQFLDDLFNTFTARYKDQQIAKANTYAFEKEFAQTLRQKMEYYNSPDADSFKQIHNKIAETQNIMHQNIDSILARGDKLELLVDRTEALAEDAEKFRVNARKLKLAMFWRRVFWYLGIFCAFCFAIWLMTSFICGFKYDQC